MGRDEPRRPDGLGGWTLLVIFMLTFNQLILAGANYRLSCQMAETIAWVEAIRQNARDLWTDTERPTHERGPEAGD
jgi:hypothetical protein